MGLGGWGADGRLGGLAQRQGEVEVERQGEVEVERQGEVKVEQQGEVKGSLTCAHAVLRRL